MSFQQQGQQPPPQARDVFESQFEKALAQLDKQLARSHDLKGQVEIYLLEIQQLQFGKNTLKSISEVKRQMIVGVLDKIDLRDKEKAAHAPRLDTSGFDENYLEVTKRFQKVDEALSFVPDIIVDFVKTLAQTDTLDQTNVHLVSGSVSQPQQLTLQKDKTGILDYFRSFVGSLKPQYRKDFEKGMGIVSTIIEDFYNTRMRWEEYKSYYVENRSIMATIGSDPRACYPIILLQDELLMQDMGLILQTIDKGVRLDLTKLHGFLSDLSKNIVQSKTAQLQQAMMPAMMGQGFNNNHHQQQQPSNGRF